MLEKLAEHPMVKQLWAENAELKAEIAALKKKNIALKEEVELWMKDDVEQGYFYLKLCSEKKELKKENAGLKDLIDAETLRDFIEKGEEEGDESELKPEKKPESWEIDTFEGKEKPPKSEWGTFNVCASFNTSQVYTVRAADKFAAVETLKLASQLADKEPGVIKFARVIRDGEFDVRYVESADEGDCRVGEENQEALSDAAARAAAMVDDGVERVRRAIGM